MWKKDAGTDQHDTFFFIAQLTNPSNQSSSSRSIVSSISLKTLNSLFLFTACASVRSLELSGDGDDAASNSELLGRTTARGWGKLIEVVIGFWLPYLEDVAMLAFQEALGLELLEEEGCWEAMNKGLKKREKDGLRIGGLERNFDFARNRSDRRKFEREFWKHKLS